MRNILILVIFSQFNLMHCQILPPAPPQPNSNIQTVNEKYDIEKIKEITEVKKTNEDVDVCKIETFKIPTKDFTNKKSKYYYKTIEKKLNILDPSITAEEIISYTKYRNSLDFNPFKLDSISSAIYKLNENSKYEEAVKLSDSLKKVSPNNITLHKELSFAYKKLGNEEMSEKHFGIMKKIIMAVEKYSDGCRINPYILNNAFEGISLYEAKFNLYPKKTRFILTESKKMIYGYDIYHIMRFADLNHYKKYLKSGEYKIE